MARDTVVRRLAHEPFGWRPTTLLVTVRRYRCTGCGRVWRQDTTAAAPPRAKISRAGLRWALEGLVVAAPDGGPGRRGARGRVGHRQRRGPGRRQAGPDRRTRAGSTGSPCSVSTSTCGGTPATATSTSPSSSTSTPIRDGTGPARLLDMVAGRSKAAFKAWLAEREQAWRDAVEVVAMDGFTGFKTAAAEELPDAVAVMDPFHVVRLAGDALDRCRRRVQQELHGHRGLAGDPLYRARRTLHTGDDLLTDRQRERLMVLFADAEHVEVEATWGIYQRMIAAYRDPDRTRARAAMTALIDCLREGVPAALVELRRLGRTLTQRAGDVLAYFDRPGTSNGPTEALNGRLEHLRGSALGFRNLTNYIARSLLETGGFRPRLHPRLG